MNARLKVRRKYHVHAPGLAAIFVAILMGVGAVNSQNNLLFIAFGLALGLILIAGFVSGSTLMHIEAVRSEPPVGRVGEPMQIVYRVRSTSRWIPAFGLVAEEVGGRGAKGWRSRLGRVRAAITHIPARETRSAHAHVVPVRRGEVKLQAVRVSTTFPFGVLKKSATFTQRTTVLVRPALGPAPTAVLDQALAGAGRTETVSRRIGRDDEFYGLREYAPGDSVRRIAWRASARSESLMIRESYATMNADVVVAISFSGGSPGESRADDRDEQAISLAASLVEIARRRGARVRLVIPAAKLVVDSHVGGDEAASCEPIHDALARLDLDKIENLRRPRPVDDRNERTSRALIVVHAREVDPSVAPGIAAHITAARASRNAAKRDSAEIGKGRAA